MADERDHGDPKFDWLYSGRSRDDQGEAGRRPVDDPEATQQIRPTDDDPEATQRIRPTDDDNRTQVLGVPPRGDDPTTVSPSPGPSTTQPPTAPPEPGAGAPASFGGTYAAPPPGRRADQGPDPRFAPPSTQQGASNRPPGPPGPTRPTKPRRRRGRLWFRAILLLVLAWVVFLVAVPIWAYSSVSKIDAEPSGDRPSDTPGTTYLLVGSDSREGLSEEQRSDLATGDVAGGRTDSIILLHVPDGDGPNLLLSIPRDSYVDLPDREKNKINAAYAFGGPELLVETVELATDLRIDNYIEVGFSGFVDMVDAVGGIEVCPKTPIDDPKAGQLTMEPGCQEVDGNTALQYSRSRAFADGDITRALHQREVISGVGRQAASWKTVVLPWRYFQVNKTAASSLGVGENVGPFDLGRFAWAMAHSSGQDTKRCVVPFTSLGASTPVGSAVIWDEAKAEAIFSAVADDDTASISCLGE